MSTVPRLDCISPPDHLLRGSLADDCAKAFEALRSDINSLDYRKAVVEAAAGRERLAEAIAGFTASKLADISLPTTGELNVALGTTMTSIKVEARAKPSRVDVVADLEQQGERLREELAIVEEEIAVLTYEPIKHDF